MYDPDVVSLHLAAHRHAARLSREQLARRAGVSPTTIKNLEGRKGRASQATILRILRVSELGLDPARLRSGAEPAPAVLNCWLSPGFDPIAMHRDLQLQLGGSGGAIEQSYLYLEHASAAAWLQITGMPSYEAGSAQTPLDRAAEAVQRRVGQAGLDLLALGCGGGRLEVRLAQHLLHVQDRRGEHPDLRLYLLDISQPLLTEAYKHAENSLAGFRGAAVVAIQGNFHHLPRFGPLHYRSEQSHRRRLVCLLGGTFHNLDNERAYVRDSLGCFGPGDLLLVDYSVAVASTLDPKAIRERDPRLSGRVGEEWTERFEAWLSGPFLRSGTGVKELSFCPELDIGCCTIPGSYEVRQCATVRAEGRPDRQFSVHHWRRYDQAALGQALRELGWMPSDGYRYGDDSGYPRVLQLFEKAG